MRRLVGLILAISFSSVHAQTDFGPMPIEGTFSYIHEDVTYVDLPILKPGMLPAYYGMVVSRRNIGVLTESDIVMDLPSPDQNVFFITHDIISCVSVMLVTEDHKVGLLAHVFPFARRTKKQFEMLADFFVKQMAEHGHSLAGAKAYMVWGETGREPDTPKIDALVVALRARGVGDIYLDSSIRYDDWLGISYQIPGQKFVGFAFDPLNQQPMKFYHSTGSEDFVRKLPPEFAGAKFIEVQETHLPQN